MCVFPKWKSEAVLLLVSDKWDGLGAPREPMPFPSPHETQAGYMGSLRYQVSQGNNDQPSRRGSSGRRFKREGTCIPMADSC